MRAWIGKYLVAGAVGGILLGAAPARADFILTLTDGSATVSVTDQGAGDLNPLPGVIVLSDDVGMLMVVMHAVMFPAMLVVMLLRYDEYAGHHHAHAMA